MKDHCKKIIIQTIVTLYSEVQTNTIDLNTQSSKKIALPLTELHFLRRQDRFHPLISAC